MDKYVTYFFKNLNRSVPIKEALQLSLKALPKHADSHDLIYRIARSRQWEGWTLRILDAALEVEPDNWEIYSTKAYELHKTDPAGALDALSQGTALLYEQDPQGDELGWCYQRMAEYLARLGRYRNRIAACTLSMDYLPSEIENFFCHKALILRADQYLKLGLEYLARKDLLRALKHNPEDKESQEKLRELSGYDQQIHEKGNY